MLMVMPPGPLAAKVAGRAGPKGFLISVDGLQYDWVRAFAEAGLLQAPGGLGDLFRAGGLSVRYARPADIAVTGPSHVSIATCSPPRVHGIFGNTFFRQGKLESGFAADILADTVWEAVERQAPEHKVQSMAFVGADGRDDRRRPQSGITYPDLERVGEAGSIRATLRRLKEEDLAGWTWASAIGGAPSRGEMLNLTVPEDRGATRTRVFAAVMMERSRAEGVDLWIDDGDRHLGNGRDVRIPADGTVVDHLFVSTHDGQLRRVSWVVEGSAQGDGKYDIHRSRVTYNRAWPDSVLKDLNESGLVWPDEKFVAGIPKSQPWRLVERAGRLDSFLAEASLRAYRSHKTMPRLILFYQPVVDSTGHALYGQLPVPFDPMAGDPLTRAYREAYQRVDANIGRLLAGLRESGDFVMVVGDHGMDRIRGGVIMDSLVEVAGGQGRVDVLSGGGLMLVYSRNGAPGEQEARRVGGAMRDAMAGLRDGEGGLVLDEAFERPQVSSAAKDSWPYGDAIWAFHVREGYVFRPRNPEHDRDPQKMLGLPMISGAHGHRASLSSMASTILLSGPSTPRLHLERGELVDAVPTLLRRLDLNPPRDCVGHDMLEGRVQQSP